MIVLSPTAALIAPRHAPRTVWTYTSVKLRMIASGVTAANRVNLIVYMAANGNAMACVCLIATQNRHLILEAPHSFEGTVYSSRRLPMQCRIRLGLP